MDWLGKLLETVIGGLPSAAIAVLPGHLKRQWRARLDDYVPFKTISANHDLLRATRLAWIEAAQEVLKEARRHLDRAGKSEWRDIAGDFEAVVVDVFLSTRDEALDRRKHPGTSPIDADVETIVNGVPELVSPGAHIGIGAAVSSRFTKVLGELSGWPVAEIPEIYGRIAASGLAIRGDGPPRAFGELVFAAFAELIKDPAKYPEAREAFHIAMDKLGRDIGQATFSAVQGLDARLDATLAGLDALEAFRAGALRYLELLPGIARDVAEARSDVAEILRVVSQQQSVPIEMLRAVLAEMGEPAATSDAREIGRLLAAKAGEFKALTERLDRLSNADPDVTKRRQLAVEALKSGRFAEADAHLAAAEARDLSSLEDLEALARQKRLSAAESRAERAAAAMLRANPDAYREAVSHYAEAARISGQADPVTARNYVAQQGLALLALGEEFGRNTALVEVIEHFRAMLVTADRNDDPLDWARTQKNLGNALLSLGKREPGTARLEEAVAVFREALTEWTRERVPLQWAATQNDLGNALLSLGEREPGTARLEEAVAVFREALKEWTRERVPLQWAGAQNNLGIALDILGKREAGTSRLDEAVATYREVLQVWTRELVPLDWAKAQNNLGIALSNLGEREAGTARLDEAVAVFREVLKERTRERVPLRWAMTQHNLGVALSALGAREAGTARLDEAVAAFREALKEWTRERAPLQWAMTQTSLGNALKALGEREAGTARLDEAAAAYREALKEGTRERVPLDWAMTQNNLGHALCILGERTTGTAQLEAAAAAYSEALREWSQEAFPEEHAKAQEKLASCLAVLRQRHAN